MGTSGDDGGSFFTMILGGGPCLALQFWVSSGLDA